MMLEAEIGWCISKIQEEARRQRILMSTRRLEEEGMDSPWRLQKEPALQHLDISPVKWLWVSCLQNSRRISYYIYYNSNRKLIHFLAPYRFSLLKSTCNLNVSFWGNLNYNTHIFALLAVPFLPLQAAQCLFSGQLLAGVSTSNYWNTKPATNMQPYLLI